MTTGLHESATEPIRTRRSVRAGRRAWRPSGLTWLIAVLTLIATTVALYPMAAQWVTAFNQAQIVEGYASAVDDADPSAADQLAVAQTYNDALTAGEVVLAEDAHKPASVGAAGHEFVYEDMLRADATGLMARVRIPAIDVDLPVLHGTDDAALLRGAGHLEGTHLPIGGTGTRAVITAHRGLANATMFTDLDDVVVGDEVVVDVFGRTLTYRVAMIEVIDPADSSTIRAVPDEDLLTLITCTPLGINSHRIVVTAERVASAAEAASLPQASTEPGIAWWLIIGVGALAAVTLYVARRGFVDARSRTSPSVATPLPRDSASAC